MRKKNQARKDIDAMIIRIGVGIIVGVVVGMVFNSKNIGIITGGLLALSAIFFTAFFTDFLKKN